MFLLFSINLLRWKWMDMNHFSNMNYRKAFRCWRNYIMAFWYEQITTPSPKITLWAAWRHVHSMTVYLKSILLEQKMPRNKEYCLFHSAYHISDKNRIYFLNLINENFDLIFDNVIIYTINDYNLISSVR